MESRLSQVKGSLLSTLAEGSKETWRDEKRSRERKRSAEEKWLALRSNCYITG
jgi:hypothetical protein